MKGLHMINIRIKLISLCAVLLSSLFTVSPVFAELEEIVVTAERRETSVQDIPIAITAFNQDQLDRLQITETLDLVRVIPNMIGANNTGLGTANTYSIRGLNNTESIATFDPPVGSYIGDSFIQRQNANNFTLFDIDRVEVLRGPQGTLFGRNTTGGAVRVILKDPADELGGFVEGGFGEYDEINFRGSIDIPFNERLRTKFSAYFVEDDGYVDVTEPGQEDLNYEESWGARIGLQLDINECATWDASITYNDNEHANVFNGEVNGERVSTSNLADNAFGGAQPFFTGGKANLPGNFNRTESTLFTSDFEFETTIGTVNFISSYITLDHEFSLDFFNGNSFGIPRGGFTIANIGEHDQFTQEVRLTGNLFNDKLEYVAGIYYFDEDNVTDFGDYFLFPLDLGPPVGVIPLELQLADRVLSNDTESVAIYAQGDYHFTDQLTLTVGARYTNEDKNIEYDDNIAGGTLNTADIQALCIATDQSTDEFTPRVALNYNWTDDVSFYGSATRGFKSGGWNARGTTPDQIIPFGPETATNYELGMKSQWLNNSVRLNLAIFKTDIDDFQLPSAFETASGGIQFITQNFADLEVDGLEAEIMWQPTDALNLFANIGFQDSEYASLNPAIRVQQQNCLDNGLQCNQGIVTSDGSIATPVRAPETSLAIGASYVFSFANGMTLTPSILYSDTGDHAIGTSNTFGDSFNYYQVNAGITLDGADDKWSIALSCTNCTDEVQEVSNLAGFVYLNEPDRWNLRAKLNF